MAPLPASVIKSYNGTTAYLTLATVGCQQPLYGHHPAFPAPRGLPHDFASSKLEGETYHSTAPGGRVLQLPRQMSLTAFLIFTEEFKLKEG